MLHQIVTFLLDVVAGLLCGMSLLRIYMQWQRIPFSNPVGRLVFALSDWLVLPLRRAIAPVGRLDLASLLAALAVELVQYLLLWLLFGAGTGWQWLPWLAVFGMVRVALTGMAGLLIAYAVLSWVQAHSPVSDVIARLSEPLLRPVRRVLPLVGGVDLSPLVVLVLVQVALMALGHLQFGPLR